MCFVTVMFFAVIRFAYKSRTLSISSLHSPTWGSLIPGRSVTTAASGGLHGQAHRLAAPYEFLVLQFMLGDCPNRAIRFVTACSGLLISCAGVTAGLVLRRPASRT